MCILLLLVCNALVIQVYINTTSIYLRIYLPKRIAFLPFDQAAILSTEGVGEHLIWWHW